MKTREHVVTYLIDEYNNWWVPFYQVERVFMLKDSEKYIMSLHPITIRDFDVEGKTIWCINQEGLTKVVCDIMQGKYGYKINKTMQKYTFAMWSRLVDDGDEYVECYKNQ